MVVTLVLSQVKKMDSVLSRLDHAMKGAWTLGLDVKGDQSHDHHIQYISYVGPSIHVRSSYS